jgi:hypothetical protein
MRGVLMVVAQLDGKSWSKWTTVLTACSFKLVAEHLRHVLQAA